MEICRRRGLHHQELMDEIDDERDGEILGGENTG
jgi:hypothetical protein